MPSRIPEQNSKEQQDHCMRLIDVDAAVGKRMLQFKMCETMAISQLVLSRHELKLNNINFHLL
jgi:hypothetical protein